MSIKEVKETRKILEEIEEDLLFNPSERHIHCECLSLRRALATNWSYYKCIKCGKSYFSSGDAKVLDFSEEDKKRLNSKRCL